VVVLFCLSAHRHARHSCWLCCNHCTPGGTVCVSFLLVLPCCCDMFTLSSSVCLFAQHAYWIAICACVCVWCITSLLVFSPLLLL
jgi:hypothetical protein